MEHFIIFNFIFFNTTCYFSSLGIKMQKELSHIFCLSAFDHIFNPHQRLSSFELTDEFLEFKLFVEFCFEVVGWNIFSVLF